MSTDQCPWCSVAISAEMEVCHSCGATLIAEPEIANERGDTSFSSAAAASVGILMICFGLILSVLALEDMTRFDMSPIELIGAPSASSIGKLDWLFGQVFLLRLFVGLLFGVLGGSLIWRR
jgi:hypothetical protein